MIKKNILATAMIVAGFAMGANASAQTYVGATAGQAKWDVNTAGATTSKTSDTAFHIFGGYDFSPNLAVEGGYFSVGKASASSGSLFAEFKGSGLDLAAVFKTDVVNGFSGFAKLGGAYVKGETFAKSGSTSGSASTNSAQVFAGLGVTYKISDTVNLRAEYERRNVKVADVSGATSTVPNISVGVQVAF